MGKWKEKNEALDEVLKGIEKTKQPVITPIVKKEAYKKETKTEQSFQKIAAAKEKTFAEMTDEEKKKAIWG